MTYVFRGIPNYDYQKGKITFIRTMRQSAVDSVSEHSSYHVIYLLHLLHTWPLIFMFIGLLVYSDHLINNFWIVHLLKLSLPLGASAALLLLFN